MKLYNTLTGKVDDFTPLYPPRITVYTCGPTVYDYPHIGNWFTFIRYDLLVRTLKAAGYEPQWVMNITDVGHLVSDADDGEDKLEKGARREGKSARDIADFYTAYFTLGMQRLNITQPSKLPKATDHIPEQIALIEKLETKGYTYRISDGIYYDTSKFPAYADFARLDLDELQAGARVEHNPEKRHLSDFALWKFSPVDRTRDMEWDSPWGKGFPGWHIECSAMCMKYLGETIDIHSGGIDHIPIHHTNEIAQSEAATGRRLANYWMHTNHVTVEGEKISKSLGNGITLEDVEAKGFSLMAFRLHVLESHYRSQSKFSWDALNAAQNRLKRFQNFAALRYQLQTKGNNAAGAAPTQTVLSTILDDLDTPGALLAIETYMDSIERIGLTASHELFDAFLQTLDSLFGLQLRATPDITDEQKQLIRQREKARSNKDWDGSDRLRDKLQQQGVGVRDTAQGSVWYYV
jgi:cysteinyl-tRNA synthetase